MRGYFPAINKKEWFFVIKISLILIFVTTIPYIYGYLITPADKFFPGIHSLGPGDYNVYYSYIEQVNQGRFIFTDLFTGEEHRPFNFNPLWLTVGLFGRFFHLPSIATLQASRAFLIFPFALVLYLFISFFIKSPARRRLGFLFSVFASGLGSFFLPLINHWYGPSLPLSLYPMDLWVSEGYNFLTLYHTPHFIAATALIIFIFLFLFKSFEKGSWRSLFFAGIASLILMFFHPFHLPTILAVPLAYIFVASWRAGKLLRPYITKYFVFLLLTSPAVIYQFLLVIYDPVAAGRAAQNICQTDRFWVFLISYGLILPFALIGLWYKKPRSNKHIFLATWLIAQFFLIFAPLTFQRRLTEGWQIPLCLFAFWGLQYFWEFIKRKKPAIDSSGYKIIFVSLIVLLFGLSNFHVVAQDLSLYTSAEFRDPPQYVYLDKGFGEAFKWMKQNLTSQDVVFSDVIASSFIAGFTGKRIYIGHSVETLDFAKKREIAKWFFESNTGDAEKEQFLKNNKITYLFANNFISVDYKNTAGIFNPATKNYLNPVFKSGEVAIYKVK
ncbi:MAG: hypothetical protein WC528_03320 [Patescibacteria group bacterium]